MAWPSTSTRCTPQHILPGFSFLTQPLTARSRRQDWWRAQLPGAATVAGLADSGFFSRRRDCHFAATPSPPILKYLLKVEGGAAECQSRRRPLRFLPRLEQNTADAGTSSARAAALFVLRQPSPLIFKSRVSVLGAVGRRGSGMTAVLPCWLQATHPYDADLRSGFDLFNCRCSPPGSACTVLTDTSCCR